MRSFAPVRQHFVSPGVCWEEQCRFLQAHGLLTAYFDRCDFQAYCGCVFVSRSPMKRSVFGRSHVHWIIGLSVLGMLGVGVLWVGHGSPDHAGWNMDESKPSLSLLNFTSAEADFRVNDRDGSGLKEFWVADVSGLYHIKGRDGQALKLIEPSMATADEAPRPNTGGTVYAPLVAFSAAKYPYTHLRYAFRSLTYHEDKPGHNLPYDLGNGRNPNAFGVVAYPYDTHSEGETFIVNEGNKVYGKDLKGTVIDTFPFDPRSAGWRLLD
jgi:hypothetical protein